MRPTRAEEGEILTRLAMRFGKFPDEVATRPWSLLRKWWDWSGGI